MTETLIAPEQQLNTYEIVDNNAPEMRDGTLKAIIVEMHDSGDWLIIKKNQDISSVFVDGQEVSLPFSNMSDMRVILQRDENGNWQVFRNKCFSTEDLKNELPIYYKSWKARQDNLQSSKQ